MRALSEAAFDSADILNVNVPVDVADPAMRLTDPHHDYDLVVDHEPAEESGDADASTAVGADGDTGDIALRDVVWPDTVGWENPFGTDAALDDRYPVGSDRRALVDGEISVSPLSVPVSEVSDPALDALVEGFNANEAARGRAGGN